jgi:aspartate/methionine/tyrosine aminotransferase
VIGARDSRDVAIRLIDEANVGLAPGSAFGAEGKATCASASRAKPKILTRRFGA